VSEDADLQSVRFEPLQPASRAQLVVGIVVGPVVWVAALIVAAIVVHYTWAIGLGLLVALFSVLLSLAALALLRRGRDREEERYVVGD
jgi:membrane protein implicated in regulation of membrane protease activity